MANALKGIEEPLLQRGLGPCGGNCQTQSDSVQTQVPVCTPVLPASTQPTPIAVPAAETGLGQSFQWMRAHDPVECTTPCGSLQQHQIQDCEQAQCDHSNLATTTNVFVLVRAKELQTISFMNTILAIISVLFAAINVVCAILNSYDNDCDPATDAHCSPATTPQTFHDLEFWATFVFNVTVLVALSYSPKVLSNKYENPTSLKLVVLSCIGLSFMSCVLVTINLAKFEILSHELEYVNELFMAVFDIIILLSLSRSRHARRQNNKEDDYKTWLTLIVSALVACVQLGVYNLSGWTKEGDSLGEKPAHFLEFAFNIISASILYWFTMDNRFCANKRLQQLMYNTPDTVDII